MNFSKENIKKIMLLIVFTILILVGLQRFDQILNVVGVLWQITFPFVLGAAMAFILNVPMNFLERVFFSRQDGKKARFSRAISLVGALLIVILIIYLVVQVVVPELGKTVVTLARTVERSLPQIQDWAANMFRDNEQIYNWINHLDMNWEKMISSALDMVKNGVGNVLTSTVSVTMGIARALLCRAEYILFDEATSSVDRNSEQEIWSCINELAQTRTLLIISHRLSTIRDADMIYVLENGQVSQRGSHLELMAEPGLYRRLVEEQAKLEQPGEEESCHE